MDGEVVELTPMEKLQKHLPGLPKVIDGKLHVAQWKGDRWRIVRVEDEQVNYVLADYSACDCGGPYPCSHVLCLRNGVSS